MTASRSPHWVQQHGQKLFAGVFWLVLLGFYVRFLFLPYDQVSYLAGFLWVRYVPFILATVLGSLPGTVAFVLFGASTAGNFSDGLPGIDLRVLGASAAIFALSLLGSRLFKRREEGRAKKEERV